MTPANHIDVYVCRSCKAKTLTVTLEAGVIPFMIVCDVCQGYAESQFGRGVEGGMIVRKQWYKPDSAELATLSDAATAHVSNGGLLMRVHPEPFPAPEPPREKTELERAIEQAAKTRGKPMVLDSRVKLMRLEPVDQSNAFIPADVLHNDAENLPGWIPTEWMRREDFHTRREGVVIRRCYARDDGKPSYSVTSSRGGKCWVMDVDGSWRLELHHVYRNDEYYRRHRFATREAALEALEESNN